MPPGLFDARTIYIQDDTAGVKLYLRAGDYPALHLGDQVTATGFVRSFHGQREISLPGLNWISVRGAGQPPAPRYLRSGTGGEAHEGRLILISGRITGFRANTFWLDDGSGEVRVLVDDNLPWRRPYFRRGDVWAVVGVVGQYDDVYRILPRYATDISRPPANLPVTGAPCAAPREEQAWRPCQGVATP